MMKIKKLPVYLTLIGIWGAILISLIPKSAYRTIEIKGEQFSITALIADSPVKKAVGLGGRKSLNATEGMLFPYHLRGYPAIWMKGMAFPIDIIWLDNGKVVDIAPMVKPPLPNAREFQTYYPSARANSVLEVNSGFCQRHDLKIGDHLTFNK